MDRIKKLGLVGVLAGSLALGGCENDAEHQETQLREEFMAYPQDYFAKIRRPYGESSPSMVTGDFDGDGNFDIVLAQQSGFQGDHERTRLYFFKGDGKGNFELKLYNKKNE